MSVYDFTNGLFPEFFPFTNLVSFHEISFFTFTILCISLKKRYMKRSAVHASLPSTKFVLTSIKISTVSVKRFRNFEKFFQKYSKIVISHSYFGISIQGRDKR